tara:strand:- start:332 stop:625 length:294 start_codon:yes stop_codon:yes gene_type:complete
MDSHSQSQSASPSGKESGKENNVNLAGEGRASQGEGSQATGSKIVEELAEEEVDQKVTIRCMTTVELREFLLKHKLREHGDRGRLIERALRFVERGR